MDIQLSLMITVKNSSTWSTDLYYAVKDVAELLDGVNTLPSTHAGESTFFTYKYAIQEGSK